MVMTENVKGSWFVEDGYFVYECECGFRAQDARREDPTKNPWSELADHVQEKHRIRNGDLRFY